MAGGRFMSEYDVEFGSVRLMFGDCLERMSDLPDGSIDMVMADPPYGTTACNWDSVIDLGSMWDQLKRVVKPNGAIVLTSAQPFTSMLVCSNLKMFKYDWVWHKNKATGFLNAKRMPLRDKEDVLVFYRKQPTYNPQKTSGHPAVNNYTKHTSDGDTVGATKQGWSGGGSTERYPKTVQKFSVVNQDGTSKEGKYHPTQKPVALMGYMIKTYTNPGEVVLDFTMGSGSTGAACSNIGRAFVGIEMDLNFYEIARHRLEEIGGYSDRHGE
jgi:DNA modification methylase